MYEYFEAGVCSSFHCNPASLSKEARAMIKKAYDFNQFENDAAHVGNNFVQAGSNLYHGAQSALQPILERIRGMFHHTPTPISNPSIDQTPTPPSQLTPSSSTPSANLSMQAPLVPAQQPSVAYPYKYHMQMGDFRAANPLNIRSDEDVYNHMSRINETEGYSTKDLENVVNPNYADGNAMGLGMLGLGATAGGKAIARKFLDSGAKGLVEKSLAPAAGVFDAGQGWELGNHFTNGMNLGSIPNKLIAGATANATTALNLVPGVNYGVGVALPTINRLLTRSEGDLRNSQILKNVGGNIHQGWVSGLMKAQDGDDRDLSAWSDQVAHQPGFLNVVNKNPILKFLNDRTNQGYYNK